MGVREVLNQSANNVTKDIFHFLCAAFSNLGNHNYCGVTGLPVFRLNILLEKLGSNWDDSVATKLESNAVHALLTNIIISNLCFVIHTLVPRLLIIYRHHHLKGSRHQVLRKATDLTRHSWSRLCKRGKEFKHKMSSRFFVVFIINCSKHKLHDSNNAVPEKVCALLHHFNQPFKNLICTTGVTSLNKRSNYLQERWHQRFKGLSFLSGFI
mmetsp:Transcript_28603/g.72961  ORF Transcript_28603/g.72961 Transcript_28603/m.72961 type:complete len:211 (-) Transcript_28603:607-1239(-)